MRILISGAHGMVGTALREALEQRGDDVGALVRGTASGPLDVAWDPAQGTIDQAALAAGGFDAVVHLAGEPLLGRWTDSKREAILHSRVSGTRTLAQALAGLDTKPQAFLVASAVGIYGNRGDELLSEESAPGGGFLADVVQQWEAAADPAREAGIRTAHLRMAAVLSTRGGALKEQLMPFKLGLGGRVGSGKQWMPWIGLDECIRIWLLALDDDRVTGPVNVVGPTPARNVDFVKALGQQLHRPTLLPVPVPALKLRYGGDLVDEMLLYSQKIVPSRLEGLDYEFEDRTINRAIARALDS